MILIYWQDALHMTLRKVRRIWLYSFNFRTIYLWNQLQDQIKNKAPVKAFKNKLVVNT